jgi:Domain of unknown function (DUF4202)
MIANQERFNRAIAGFDAANSEDPNSAMVDGKKRPKELVYAERLTAMLDRYAPASSEAVRLAVRCQHIQRWKIPRADYPKTSQGYKQWRTRLMEFHAEIAGAILRESGYDDEMTRRVQALLRKKGLKINPETQTLEDVIDLVFLENYLAEFVAGHGEYDEAKWIDILRKTSEKMSASGRAAALTLITLPQHLAPLVHKALGALKPGGAAP